MIVTPKLVDSNIPSVQLSANLCLSLRSGSVCPDTSLKSLLETIEQHIFKGVEYILAIGILRLFKHKMDITFY